MRFLKLALLATAATAALSSAAFAADLIVDVPATDAQVIDNSSGWDGGYIGAFIAGQTVPDAFGVGVNLGVNTLMNGLLLGGELEMVALTGPNYSAQGTLKVGGALGDMAIIYAYSGVGSRTASSWYVPVGVGTEFKVADNVGLKAEAQYNFDLTTSAQDSAAVKVGLNWHF